MTVLVVLIAVAAGATLVAIASLTWGRGHRFDDVERFHRARAMTTEWARAGVPPPASPPVDEREPADA